MNLEEERPSQQPHCNDRLVCPATALSGVMQRSPLMTCSGTPDRTLGVAALRSERGMLLFPDACSARIQG